MLKQLWLVVLLIPSQLVIANADTVIPTGDMVVAREGHAATLLPDGRVLISGGSGGETSAEIYDPLSGTFSLTGSLNVARKDHQAILLNDAKVLLVGGFSDTSEIYNPTSGQFTLSGNSSAMRGDRPGVVKLADGRVVVLGGSNSSGTATSNIDLYNPSTGVFTHVANLVIPRRDHATALLPDGRILVAGGVTDSSSSPLNSAEIYDPATSTSHLTLGSMSVGRARQPDAVALQNGKILVVGPGGDFPPAEVFDPVTEEFAVTGNGEAIRSTRATLLNDGRVLVSGGNPYLISDGLLLVYGPATEIFTTLDADFPMYGAVSSTKLLDGKVLLAGGSLGGVQSTFRTTRLFIPPVYFAQVRPPINLDGSSIFKSKRGTVPLKFELTADGLSTCDLPPATLALVRISGVDPGPVNETDYATPADDGSNFKISGCQYYYNLGTSTLGPGLYRIEIKISGAVVGSATFGLN